MESDFSETTFQKTNTAKRKNTFLETKPNFCLTGKCFSLTGKCFCWLESVFRWPTFLMANKHKKVWKVNSGKQTWPKFGCALCPSGYKISITNPLYFQLWRIENRHGWMIVHYPDTKKIKFSDILNSEASSYSMIWKTI